MILLKNKKHKKKNFQIFLYFYYYLKSIKNINKKYSRESKIKCFIFKNKEYQKKK